MNIDRAVSHLSLVICSLVCASWLAVASTASAQSVPRQCTAKSGQAAKYTAGLAAGQQKADQFFASADIGKNPKKLQNKIARMLDKLHVHIRDAMHGDSGQGKRCRIQGVTEGFLGRIAQLVGQCILDGGTWGQFTADLYCELSAELGGLGEPTPFVRVPVGICGTLFQQVCDGVYRYVATEGGEPLEKSVQSFLSTRGLNVSTFPGCEEFTEGELESIFESARTTDCAYGVQ